MRRQENRFIEKMQPILTACVGGAILVAPQNYLPIADFRIKVKEKLRLELRGLELIMPSHSQVDLVTRHYSLAQLLSKSLIFNAKEPDFVTSTPKRRTDDRSRSLYID